MTGSLFASLVPAEVHTHESWDVLMPSSVFPEETAAVASAIPQRRQEFWTGRALARQVLARLGHPPTPIPHGRRGAPLWPAGVVGSITHTDRYAAVALASLAGIASVGIDAQPVALLPPEVVGVVTTSREQARLASVAGDLAALLAFVAKEAVFKAWWPLRECELDFAEVELWPVQERPTESGELIAEFVDAASARSAPWEVRWRVADGLLLAAVAVSH